MEDTPINKYRHLHNLRRRRLIIKSIITILLLLTVKTVFSLSDSSNSLTVQADTVETDLVELPVVPSSDPYHFIVWTQGGFKRQPEPYYSVKRGETITINTETVRPFLRLNHIEHIEYHWEMRTDLNKNWEKLSDHKNNLIINTKNLKAHDLYFQAQHSYGIIRPVHYYSKMAHVHISDHEVKADSLNVNVGNDYLYTIPQNEFFDNSTYAKATPTPKEATGKVQWTLEKFKGSKTVPILDNELGSITSDGLVTAKDNAEGVLNVTGYIKNKDGTFVSDTKNITVGGGLADQTGHVNGTATFHIETGDSGGGDNQLENVSVQWYRGGKAVSNNSSDPFELVTGKLTEAEDCNKYRAVINYKKNFLPTREATLHVLPPLDPTVSLVTKMENLSYDKTVITDNILNDVTSDDKIKYTFILKNGGLRDLKKSQLSFPLDNQTLVESIQVNDKEINVLKDEKSVNQLVTIPIADLSHDEGQTVTVITKIPMIDEIDHFSFRPTLVGYYDDMKHRYESDGDLITLNYTPNEIHAEFQNINFQPINPFEKNIFKRRTYSTNAPNEIVSISDTRRNKVPLKLSVKQIDDFVDVKGNILAAELSYVGSASQPISVGQKIQVAESKRTEQFESIKWDENQGLMLHVADSLVKPGNYQTTLVWNFENTI